MSKRDEKVRCAVCDKESAQPGEYCEQHREELHQLDHQYENLFRLQRTSRGDGHEAFNLFLRGQCEPCGRILVTETDPGDLSITLLISGGVDLETPMTEYLALGIDRTWGDQLQDRLRDEIVHSWYGNARACIDVLRTVDEEAVHWDVERRGESPDDGAPTDLPPSGGSRRSVH